MKPHPVVGLLVPFLGGPFGVFDTGLMNGLAQVRGKRLDLLAINAYERRKGHGGRFLAECQREYDVIGVWEIWNQELAAMLARRGFKPETDVLFNEASEGLIWRRGV